MYAFLHLFYNISKLKNRTYIVLSQREEICKKKLLKQKQNNDLETAACQSS